LSIQYLLKFINYSA